MATNEEYIKRNKIITIDHDKNTKLHYAAALNNYEEVEKEIATGRKLDPENYLGWTPLMMAVRNGNRAIVNLLLSKRADATKKNKFGMSVFLISVTCGDIDILETILNHLLSGGISRQTLQKHFSPISLAILFGQSHILKYLIDRSFDVNATTPLTGISPLMFAAAVGNNKAFKKLLQQKADTKKKNYLGQTAHEIMQSRNQKVSSIISKKIPPQLPVIVISTTASNNPYFQLTPYPVTNMQTMRKSSNAHTPNMLCSPHITPITPQLMPQMFFPPEFSPGQFTTPTAYHSNNFLNGTFNQSAFLSPMP